MGPCRARGTKQSHAAGFLEALTRVYGYLKTLSLPGRAACWAEREGVSVVLDAAGSQRP